MNLINPDIFINAVKIERQWTIKFVVGFEFDIVKLSIICRVFSPIIYSSSVLLVSLLSINSGHNLIFEMGHDWNIQNLNDFGSYVMFLPPLIQHLHNCVILLELPLVWIQYLSILGLGEVIDSFHVLPVLQCFKCNHRLCF